MAKGSPREVLTPGLLHDIFDLQVLVDAHPTSGPRPGAGGRPLALAALAKSHLVAD